MQRLRPVKVDQEDNRFQKAEEGRAGAPPSHPADCAVNSARSASWFQTPPDQDRSRPNSVLNRALRPLRRLLAFANEAMVPIHLFYVAFADDVTGAMAIASGQLTVPPGPPRWFRFRLCLRASGRSAGKHRWVRGTCRVVRGQNNLGLALSSLHLPSPRRPPLQLGLSLAD